MLMSILVLILAALAIVLIIAATKPNTFRLERSLVIQAAPETIAAHITDFHKWADWSPWEKIDPTMTRSYSGAAAGVGAIYDWTGTGKAGTGRMEIRNLAPAKRVEIQLDFFKPFKARNTVEFTLTPQGNATKVVWAMYGPAPYMTKLMHTVMNMDALVGKDFEKGLASLKQISEIN